MFKRMNLREYMDKHKLTQVKAAERLGVEQQEISRYLRGRVPTVPVAIQMRDRSDGEIDIDSWVAKPAPVEAPGTAEGPQAGAR